MATRHLNALSLEEIDKRITLEAGYFTYQTPSGELVLLNYCDFNLVYQYSLHMSGRKGTNQRRVRAYSFIYQSQIYLGPLLLGPPEGMFVDHINRDTLDNRRANLRLATRTENTRNRGNWGQYPKGISFDQKKQLYRARIQVDKKRIGLGRFKNLEDAVNAYEQAASKYFGEFKANAN